MHYDLSQLPPQGAYKLLTALVVPRPIAWVSTLNPDGTLNLAPFSYFNLLGSDPAVVAFSPGDRPDGTPKDTARNIGPGGEFVVNLVNEALAGVMNLTATDFPAGVDEAQTLGIELAAGVQVRVPHVAQSPASLECREVQTVMIGRNRIILGEVLGVQVQDALLVDAGRLQLDLGGLRLIGRVGGRSGYTRTTDTFELERVGYEAWRKE